MPKKNQRSETSEKPGAKASTALYLTEDFVTKLSWLFLILPGFLSYTCLSLIARPSEHSELEILAYSFGLLLINLTITLPIVSILARFDVMKRQVSIFPELLESSRLNLGFYFILLIVSVFTGVSAGIISERDLFYRFVKAVPILYVPIQDSSRHPLDRILLQNQTGLNHYEKPNPDQRTFKQDRPVRATSTTAYVRVELSNKQVIEGYLLYFDATKKDSQIYLSPACIIYQNKNPLKVRPIAGPGVIIYEKHIINIRLLDTYTTICSSFWETPPNVRKNIPEIAGLEMFGLETEPDAVIKNIEAWNARSAPKE